MLHESQVPRSCDRCYVVKERCERTPGVAKCERCTRVGHACESKRPTKRPGRPPAPYLQSGSRRSRAGGAGAHHKNPVSRRKKDASTPPTAPATTAWQNVLSSVGHLTHQEVALIDRAVNHDDFTKQFVLGPSFFNDHRQKLVFHLLSSRPVVLDGFLAVSLACGDKMMINHSFKHATSALLKLRSFIIKDRLDMTSCLVLGWQILHFALNAGGGQPLEICSQTLDLIKPHYAAEKHLESAYVTFLTSLVFTETAECLMQTRMPTLRVNQAQHATQIDGCVGLCTTLLPLLYDVAEINFEMYTRSQQIPNASPRNMVDLLERLEIVKMSITLWKPPVPDDFCTKYTSVEIAHMMCQMHVTQTAFLLIIHRLQHPFGTENGTAQALASTILSHLDMTVHVTKKTAMCVDISLIAACLEVEDEADRAQRLRSFSAIGSHSAVFQQRINGLISLVWAARLRQPQLYWYHLGSILARSS